IYSRGHAAGLSLLSPFFIVAYGWLAGKPIAMLPQTIGPLWRGWERVLVRWLLDRIEVISLRDLTSVELMQRMGVPASRYHLTPDIAFLYAGADRRFAQALLGHYGVNLEQTRPLLGVTLINWGAQHPQFKGQAHYEAAVAAAIRHFVQTYHGQALLFAQVCGPTPADDDRIPARRVHAMLSGAGLNGSVTVVDEEVPAGTLKAAYGAMDLLLGSRLHSNIFTLSEGTPVLAIAYQDKTFGVLRMLHLGEWVRSIEAVQADELVRLLDQLWSRRTEVRQQLAVRIPILQKEAQQSVALIRAAVGRKS
nr:polysaccharide pyruvyl transferase family protein [Caldilineaceae bacterium]